MKRFDTSVFLSCLSSCCLNFWPCRWTCRLPFGCGLFPSTPSRGFPASQVPSPHHKAQVEPQGSTFSLQDIDKVNFCFYARTWPWGGALCCEPHYPPPFPTPLWGSAFSADKSSHSIGLQGYKVLLRLLPVPNFSSHLNLCFKLVEVGVSQCTKVLSCVNSMKFTCKQSKAAVAPWVCHQSGSSLTPSFFSPEASILWWLFCLTPSKR